MADPTYTQDDLDRVRLAIARGEQTVQFADRSVTYRSITQLMQAEEFISSQLRAAVGHRKQTLGFATKGF